MDNIKISTFCIIVSNVAWRTKTSFVFLLSPEKVASTIPFRHQSGAIREWLTLMGPNHSYFFSWIFSNCMTELWKKMILYFWLLTHESEDEWTQGKAWQVYLYNPFQQINVRFRCSFTQKLYSNCNGFTFFKHIRNIFWALALE